MKKLSLLICLLLLGVYGTAQNKAKAVDAAVEATLKKLPAKTGAARMPGHPRALTGANAPQALRAVPVSARPLPQAKRPLAPKVPAFSAEEFLSKKFSREELEKLPREQKEQLYTYLWNANADFRAQLQAQRFQSGIGKSVLFAPLMSSQEIGYSVTVFKTRYQGQEEIFGVLPSHALPNDFSHRYDSVGKEFQVLVKQADGTEKPLHAQVVQISPQSMLDISLVKFDPQEEHLLVPLRLADTPAQLHEILFSYGFAAGHETFITRNVNSQSFLSVRTNQAIEGAREGFCGSPLLDMNGDIKAIHTGTKELGHAQEDVSFGTHVTFIRKLVEAYHNGGQADYDLVLDGQTLANLQVDEYISAFYLYDENGKKLLQHNVEDKFSQTVLLKALRQHPQARYLQLTSRKAQWNEEDDIPILKEERSGRDKTKRQHWYNLQTRQIEPVRPAVIKL